MVDLRCGMRDGASARRRSHCCFEWSRVGSICSTENARVSPGIACGRCVARARDRRCGALRRNARAAPAQRAAGRATAPCAFRWHCKNAARSVFAGVLCTGNDDCSALTTSRPRNAEALERSRSLQPPNGNSQARCTSSAMRTQATIRRTPAPVGELPARAAGAPPTGQACNCTNCRLIGDIRSKKWSHGLESLSLQIAGADVAIVDMVLHFNEAVFVAAGGRASVHDPARTVNHTNYAQPSTNWAPVLLLDRHVHHEGL